MIKKLLTVGSIITLSLIVGATSSFAASTLKAYKYGYSYVPNYSYDLQGYASISLTDTGYVTGYGQTRLTGFFEGTAPVDSMSVKIDGYINGSYYTTASKSANKGSASPNVSINLGKNDWSIPYNVKGYHKAYRNGSNISTASTSVQW
ncbi:MAG: hypothetical protein ABF649_15930 [Bacillus sp. (in: firmicutes)]